MATCRNLWQQHTSYYQLALIIQSYKYVGLFVLRTRLYILTLSAQIKPQQLRFIAAVEPKKYE